MIDYLITSNDVDQANTLNALVKVRPDLTKNDVVLRTVGGFHLAYLGSPYAGFEPWETDERFYLVVGGPAPKDTNHRMRLSQSEPNNVYTRILSEAIESERNDYSGFLGGFQWVSINKSEETVQIVTDPGGTIPAYGTTTAFAIGASKELIVGSHADAIALTMGRPASIDVVSIADFLAYQTVTVPYTFYSNIQQLPAGSRANFFKNRSADIKSYWAPNEIDHTGYSICDSARDLREIFKRNVQRAASEGSGVTVLMSGGEDSRVVLSTIPEAIDKNSVTVADTNNHEARVAKRVSHALGSKWRLIERPANLYLENARASIKLSESHNLFYHAHFNGLEEKIGKNEALLGGLMADALCKASHVKKIFSYGVVTDTKPNEWRHLGTAKLLDLPPQLNEMVEKRRDIRNAELKELRPESWAEWHSLYPGTMNTNSVNYFVTRRLFHCYEPFSDSEILYWSAKTPIHWKLNRNVFQRAMKPILKKTRLMRHAKGTFPSLDWRVNGPLSFILSHSSRAKKKVHRLLKVEDANDGPWPIWKSVVNSALFSELHKYPTKAYQENLSKFLGEEVFELMEKSLVDQDPVQALCGLQVRLWADMLVDTNNFES